MLDGISVSSLTPSVLLGIAILMVLLGWLVPKSVLREKTKEATAWRQAYEAEREARVTADAQTAELLELAKTTHSIVVALFSTAPSNSRYQGEANVVSTPTRR